MRSLLVAACALLHAALGLETDDARYLVLPPPKMVHAKGGDWVPYHLHPAFEVVLHDASTTQVRGSAQLARMLARAQSVLAPMVRATHALSHVPVAGSVAISKAVLLVESVAEPDFPSLSTDYSYVVSVSHRTNTATINAHSKYGAAYALESLTQLFTARNGSTEVAFPTQLMLHDSPAQSWRGIMLDSGRRFFPVAAVQNFLDVMAQAKLNVLHFHLSDECRWSVESKLYPNLTAALSGVLGGFYTQADIRGLVSYAGDLGIRIVPEFDVVGHTHGMIPISSEVEFCYPTDASRSQLYGDPANKTYNVLTALFAEMAGLFPDEVFHIGECAACIYLVFLSTQRRVTTFTTISLRRDCYDRSPDSRRLRRDVCGRPLHRAIHLRH